MASPHEHIGPYRILRELGRGGQAIVYLAEHRVLGRQVALKVLKRHAIEFASDAAFARFKREAEVTSRLDHPGVCGVYEAGEDEGFAFIAMRYVRGEPLSTKLARAKAAATDSGDTSFFLSTDEDNEAGEAETADPATSSSTASAPSSRGELFATLRLIEHAARALHVAHEAGLVHRDIKPGNIMVTDDGDPVLLDFGLARDEASADHTLTREGELMGTPYYMSPEQLLAHRVPIDRRTDVYSLGVTLYECLTLARPYDAPSREALYQKIITADSPDPRRVNPRIPREAKIVIETAIDRDKDRRYQTALAFAEDLARIRKFEPIAARPLGPWLRGRRWTQRHPVLAVSMTLLLIAFGASIGLSVWALQERRGKDRALAEVRREHDALQQANTETKRALRKLGTALGRSEGLRLAARATRLAPTEAALALSLAIEAAQRAPGVEADRALRDALDAHRGGRSRMIDGVNPQFAADANRILALGRDGRVYLHDLTDGRRVRSFGSGSPSQRRRRFAVDRAARRLAIADGSRGVLWDGTAGKRIGGLAVRLEAADRGEIDRDDVLERVSFSADGRHVVGHGFTRAAWVWDAHTGRLVHTLGGHADHVAWARFVAGGERIVTLCTANVARVWSVSSGRAEATIALSKTGQPLHSTVDRAGVRLISVDDRTVSLVRLASGRIEHAWEAPADVSATAFSPDGARCVTGTVDGSVRVFDTATGKPLHVLRGHDGRIDAIVFSPDERWIATVSHDRTARLWDARTARPLGVLRPPSAGTGAQIATVAFSPDSRFVVLGDSNRGARVHEIELLDTARAARTREFTLAELDTFDLGDRALRARVRELFDRHPLREDFVRALDELDGLTPLIRRAAAEDARRRETPEFLNNTSWTIALSPGKPIGRYRLALRLVNAARRLAPDDESLRDTIGLARFRVGDHAGALAMFDRAHAKNVADGNRLFLIFDYAFIAMCHHHLGNRAEAERALANAKKTLGDLTDEASRGFVRRGCGADRDALTHGGRGRMGALRLRHLGNEGSNRMASITPLDSLDDWADRWEALQSDGAAPLLIFKKSPICPVSHFVEQRVTDWLANAPDDLAVVFVDVVNDRPVSQRIAADTGVTHQSPQALAIAAGGRVVWHDSHDRVDEEALDGALNALR